MVLSLINCGEVFCPHHKKNNGGQTQEAPKEIVWLAVGNATASSSVFVVVDGFHFQLLKKSLIGW